MAKRNRKTQEFMFISSLDAEKKPLTIIFIADYSFSLKPQKDWLRISGGEEPRRLQRGTHDNSPKLKRNLFPGSLTLNPSTRQNCNMVIASLDLFRTQPAETKSWAEFRSNIKRSHNKRHPRKWKWPHDFLFRIRGFYKVARLFFSSFLLTSVLSCWSSHKEAKRKIMGFLILTQLYIFLWMQHYVFEFCRSFVAFIILFWVSMQIRRLVALYQLGAWGLREMENGRN